MENNYDTLQEQLRALASGELDEAARQALHEKARNSPEIADELAFSNNLVTALRHSDMLAAKTILDKVIEEEGFPPPAAPGPSGKWWLIRAGMALAVVGLLSLAYFWNAGRSTSLSESQELSRHATQALENVLFLPDTGIGIADLRSGMAAYDAARYAEAARALGAYVDRRGDNAARVYLGVSFLLSGQARAAIAPLADAARSPEPPVQEAALWYLALAYLETDNPRAARQALESIPAGGLFGDQARELKDKIK